MSKKLAVGMGYTVDPITLEKNEHDVILGKTLVSEDKSDLGKENFLGFEFSEDSKEKIEKGMIALVESLNDVDSEVNKKIEIDIQDIKRSGKVAWLNREFFAEVFEVSEDELKEMKEFIMVPSSTFKQLEELREWMVEEELKRSADEGVKA